MSKGVERASGSWRYARVSISLVTRVQGSMIYSSSCVISRSRRDLSIDRRRRVTRPPRRRSTSPARTIPLKMAPSQKSAENFNKKLAAKASRGIVSSGAAGMGSSGPNPKDLKPKETPCPHCDRLFKQQDRVKQALTPYNHQPHNLTTLQPYYLTTRNPKPETLNPKP